MIIQSIKEIMIKKYNNYQIYIHNLANFDGIFLLKILTELGEIKPLIHNEKILTIGFKFKDYNIIFKDSLQMLIVALRKLAKAFGVITQKGIFPYKFVNENNLDYIGEVPDFKYFDNISINDYNDYSKQFNNNWSLKNEVIKYCEIDCISLYKIMIKFSCLIFDLFKINIHNHSTLSSLAYAIFRTHFLKKDEIPQLSGQIEKDIRQSYTGGAVDMYIPRIKKGTKIFCYDVNSLYPFVMKNLDMPVGKPIQFFGDIRKVDPNAFGFFYCKIIAPDKLEHPILQTHVNVNKGIRTMAPLGKWEDMIFSAEMDNAMKYGYKFEILWGYTFESANIFEEYVNFLFKLRQQYPPTDPLNFIAKILLNSLYGRFGMDDNFANINVIHKDYYPDFENKYLDNIIDKIELGEYWLVFYNTIDDSTEDIGTHNVSISIAAAITAWARVHMTIFKNNPKINLYYTDTDSAYTDSDIDQSLICNKTLGKLKFESKSVEAIFLGPKMYCLNIIDQGLKYKIKGLKSTAKLNLDDFKNLLIKNFDIKKEHTKWFRNLDEAKISVLEQIYTIKVTENKRKLLYNKNNKLIATKAYKINLNKEIIN
jgi:DNA polymerase type B, organellar and viral